MENIQYQDVNGINRTVSEATPLPSSLTVYDPITGAQKVVKGSAVKNATIAINTALVTAPITSEEFTQGSIEVGETWTAANIAFMICDTVNGTYVKARDDSGSPYVISGIKTAEAGSYKIPPEVLVHPYFKPRSESTAEALVNQTAARALKIYLR